MVETLQIHTQFQIFKKWNVYTPLQLLPKADVLSLANGIVELSADNKSCL